MTRRELLKGAAAAGGAAALSLAGFPALAAGPGKRPNILFILADDLGYGDLGCYGQQQIQTFHLDRLAAAGMRFTDCYAGSTVCAPSRCCLMTGMHTGHARVRGNALVPLRPEDTTVAEVLKTAGYTTGIIGKWGLGEPNTAGIPNRQGFDEWFGYLNQAHAHNYYPEYLWRNEQRCPLPGNTNGRKEEYSNDLFAREALDFIRRHREEPFFLYMNFTLPHANNELGAKTGNGMEVPSDSPYSDRAWPPQEKNRAAMITRMDRDVGRILALLRELDLEEDTIVFFTSDNGPHKEGGSNPAFFRSSGPLRGIKRDLYEGGIRVPMIARWPGKLRPGVVSDQVWAFWDFLPTAAALAGAQAPTGIDGISMAPALLQGQPVAHAPLYWEFHEGGFKQAVRLGHWKGVRLGPRKPLELYDLSRDLGETRNVAEQHPKIVAQMEAFLRSTRTDSPEFPIREGGGKGKGQQVGGRKQ